MTQKKANIILTVVFGIIFILSLVAVSLSFTSDSPGITPTPSESGGSESTLPPESSDTNPSQTTPTEHVHNFVFSSTIEPTCTAQGYDLYTCTLCDEVESRNLVPALGHNYNDEHICERCGEIDPLSFTPGLIFSVNEDRTAWVITGYEGGDNEVNIPGQYSEDDGKNYYPVEEISAFAFEGSSIVSINIGGISKIANSAFLNCTFLTSVKLSPLIEEIEASAFYGCAALTEIELPENLQAIGSYAFAYCSSLSTIYYNSKELTSDLGKDSNLLTGSGSAGDLTIIIGDETLFVPSYLAYNTNLTTLTIGESVARMGTHCFSSCYNLTTINYNATSPSLELTKESSIFTTGANATVTFGSNVTQIPDYLFYGCANLTTINFGSNINTIGNYSFSKCISLTDFNFPSSLKTIESYAFSECSMLSNVNILDSITKLGVGAFQYCGRLTSLTIGLGVSLVPKYFASECNSLSQLSLGGNVSVIAEGAFQQTAIEKLDFSTNTALTRIELKAFSMCRNLTSVRFANYVNVYQNCFSQTNVEYLYLENQKMISSANSYTDLGGILASIKKIYILKSLENAEDYKPGNQIKQLMDTIEETVNGVEYISHHSHQYSDGSCIICNQPQ